MSSEPEEKSTSSTAQEHDGPGWYTAASFAIHLSALLLVMAIQTRGPSSLPIVTFTTVDLTSAPVAQPLEDSSAAEEPIPASDELVPAEPPKAEAASEDVAPPVPADPEPVASEDAAPVQEEQSTMQAADTPPETPEGGYQCDHPTTRCPGTGMYYGYADGPSRSHAVADSGMGKAQTGGDTFDDGPLSSFGLKDGPKIIEFAKPAYPMQAYRMNVEGVVILRLKLDDMGRVVRVTVVEPAGNGFDEAAIESVKRSVFGPAVVGGRPVACSALLPFRFRMN